MFDQRRKKNVRSSADGDCRKDENREDECRNDGAGEQGDQESSAEGEFAEEDPAVFEQVKDDLRKSAEALDLSPASCIMPLAVEWLWPGRIPRGHLTLLAGDPDVGKSLLAIDLAARVSTGTPWPDEPDRPRQPGNALILTAHDNPNTMLRPRLERAGADLNRVFFTNGVSESIDIPDKGHRPIRLPDNLASLARALIDTVPVRLVVLDSAWAFCSRGPGVVSRNAGPAQLSNLASLAAKFRVPIVCVTDLRRVTHGTRPYQVGGNQALRAAARVAWGIVAHPRERDRRVMLPLKMNLGPPGTGLEFVIGDDGIAWQAEPAKVSAEAVFAAERAGSDLEGAEEWLRTYLAHGSRPSREILAQATECGLSKATLRRAKENLGVQAVRAEFEKGHWRWTLGGGGGGGRGDANESEIARLCAAG